MTLTQPEAPTSTQRMSTPVTSWMPFAVALTAALALAVFILLPFYANGLHHLPLDEVAGGAHDPKDLWPVAGGSAFAGLFRLCGMLTLVTAPFVAVGCALYGGYAVWRHRADRSRWLPDALTVALGVGVLGWLATPTARAIGTWFMD